jgi:hypothetical protein
VINYDTYLVSALKTVLPTHYELALTANIATPCISYQERNNYDEDTGTTIGYSRIIYTIKVWGNEIKQIKQYAKDIDRVLRPLGFKRTSSGELHDIQTSMIQQIMTYEARGLEEYN